MLDVGKIRVVKKNRRTSLVRQQKRLDDTTKDTKTEYPRPILYYKVFFFIAEHTYRHALKQLLEGDIYEVVGTVDGSCVEKGEQGPGKNKY